MKKISAIVLLFLALVQLACQQNATTTTSTYFNSIDTGLLTGGIKMISVNTEKGKFNVWTKRVGNNPKIKVLLLTGGPGASHEYFECFESFFPKEEIEFIYYDQLGTGYSDNPNDTTYWNLNRYVEEVEQVRSALGLHKDNFYLLGHSWGGILAMEYALKYQQNLKGLVVSNMMSSAPAYDKYADVLAAKMDPNVLKKLKAIESAGKYEDPQYMELLLPNFYTKHVLRMPLEQWPEPLNRAFAKLNHSLYVTMQGPSEMGISGKLANWDRSAQLKNITVPTLTIGAQYDTMDPKHMAWMAKEFKNGSYLYCKNGSHMSLYDDQQAYMKGIIKFLKTIDSGKTKVDF